MLMGAIIRFIYFDSGISHSIFDLSLLCIYILAFVTPIPRTSIIFRVPLSLQAVHEVLDEGPPGDGNGLRNIRFLIWRKIGAEWLYLYIPKQAAGLFVHHNGRIRGLASMSSQPTRPPCSRSGC